MWLSTPWDRCKQSFLPTDRQSDRRTGFTLLWLSLVREHIAWCCYPFFNNVSATLKTIILWSEKLLLNCLMCVCVCVCATAFSHSKRFRNSPPPRLGRYNWKWTVITTRPQGIPFLFLFLFFDISRVLYLHTSYHTTTRHSDAARREMQKKKHTPRASNPPATRWESYAKPSLSSRAACLPSSACVHYYMTQQPSSGLWNRNKFLSWSWRFVKVAFCFSQNCNRNSYVRLHNSTI